MGIDTVTLSDITQVDSFIAFWSLLVDVWRYGLMGIDIGRILTALLIFSIFLLIRGLFSKYVLARLQKISSRTDTMMDDKLIEAIIPPLHFVPVIVGLFVSTQYLGLDEPLAGLLGKVIRSLIVFTIFWALYRALEPLSHLLRGLEKILTKMMVQWVFKVLRVVVIFVGGAVVLEIWGIRIGPLLAGLGLFGAAVALGAQDLFKNLIAGVTVISEKRFQPGEWIKVEGVVEGTVEDIGFRSTKIRRFDKAPVHVPNSSLADAVVTNFSRMTHRRIYWKLGVEYKTTVEQLKIIRDEIESYVKENKDFESSENVSTFVRVDSFGPSSIDFLVYCFTKTTIWGEWLEVKEQLALAIKDIVEKKAKAGFAFPSQSLYVEKFVGELPEVFIPPQHN